MSSFKGRAGQEQSSAKETRLSLRLVVNMRLKRPECHGSAFGARVCATCPFKTSMVPREPRELGNLRYLSGPGPMSRRRRVG
jgi:hypothetical protein